MALAPWDATNQLQSYAEGLRERIMTYFEVRDLGAKKPKLVAVTGCGRGVGVSTLASGLAAELSKTGDGNVLLVDVNGDQGVAHSFHKGRPGCGVGDDTRDLVAAILQSEASAVLDADALTSFQEESAALFRQISPNTVLTPHEGEFERLFPGLLVRSPSRIEAVREAAAQAGCVVLLKGADTAIADPGGRVAVCTNAPPYLATAGAGDVLSGIIAGLLAQKMPPWQAAAAAAWLHGEAAKAFGLGLIAEDLPEQLPAVLRLVYGEN